MPGLTQPLPERLGEGEVGKRPPGVELFRVADPAVGADGVVAPLARDPLLRPQAGVVRQGDVARLEVDEVQRPARVMLVG